MKNSVTNFVEATPRARDTAAHTFMKAALLSAVIGLAWVQGAFAAEPPPALRNPRPLFDGKSLANWEGNAKLWRVEDGALTGGSLVDTVRANDFLATTRDYTNFVIRFQIKLTGSNG